MYLHWWFLLQIHRLKFQNGNIKCSSTKVKHCNFISLDVLSRPYAKDAAVGSFTIRRTLSPISCFFSSLTFETRWSGRNCNNGICYLLSKVIFGSFLHFLKYHSRNLLWNIQTTVYINTGSVVIATIQLYMKRGEISFCTWSNVSPMKRLVENIVFSEFVMAWRFAGSPTLRSPPSTNATIEGVVLLPSLL